MSALSDVDFVGQVEPSFFRRLLVFDGEGHFEAVLWPLLLAGGVFGEQFEATAVGEVEQPLRILAIAENLLRCGNIGFVDVGGDCTAAFVAHRHNNVIGLRCAGNRGRRQNG